MIDRPARVVSVGLLRSGEVGLIFVKDSLVVGADPGGVVEVNLKVTLSFFPATVRRDDHTCYKQEHKASEYSERYADGTWAFDFINY
jgi:hypothetical protein